MTVKELIEVLKQFPEDTFVYTSLNGYCDSKDGPLNIQGTSSTVQYEEKEDILHLVSDFCIATTVSK